MLTTNWRYTDIHTEPLLTLTDYRIYVRQAVANPRIPAYAESIILVCYFLDINIHSCKAKAVSGMVSGVALNINVSSWQQLDGAENYLM